VVVKEAVMALVVVGVDGSQQSRRALAWAVDYAAERGATVQAVQALPGRDGAGDGAGPAARTEAEERLVALVEDVLAAADRPPIVSCEVAPGDPVTVVLDAAARADLVVLGSHGMSRLRNPALGSVSLACIRFGRCPVVVIPVAQPPWADPAPGTGAVELALA
jgi:nucleotide-binding universal stress UspA family protein